MLVLKVVYLDLFICVVDGVLEDLLFLVVWFVVEFFVGCVVCWLLVMFIEVVVFGVEFEDLLWWEGVVG